MQICLFALLLCAHFDWILCCFVHILIAYFVVKIIKHCFNWFWFYTVNRGIRSRNIFLREKKILEEPEYFKTTLCIRYNDLQIAEQDGKVQEPEAWRRWKYERRASRRYKTGKISKISKIWRTQEEAQGKKEQLELLGFIGTDKMARVDEDVNNRLFRREIRILTLLL